MKKRTTVSVNQDFIASLKVLGAKRDQTLSSLVNEAIREYLSKIRKKKENKEFFDQLNKLKEKISLTQNDLQKAIEKGRL